MMIKDGELIIGPLRFTHRTRIVIAVLLKLLMPLLSVIGELIYTKNTPDPGHIAKWFLFWGLGIYLLTSGVIQMAAPASAAVRHYGLRNRNGFDMIRQLGICKLSLGAAGVISLFDVQLQSAAAFISAIYFGMSTLWHFLKKGWGPQDVFILVMDLLIFSISLLYLFYVFFF